MTADQFIIKEHCSYDMIGTWYYQVYLDHRRTEETETRFGDFMRESYFVEPIYCEFRLFPDFEFNAQEFAKR